MRHRIYPRPVKYVPGNAPLQGIESSYAIFDEYSGMECCCFETLVGTSQEPLKVKCHRCVEKDRVKEKLGDICGD